MKNKTQFLADYTRDKPANTGIPKYSTNEVLDIMEKWEYYVDTTLPNKNEISKEANEQKNLDARVAFKEGAEYVRTHRFYRPVFH